MTATSFPAPAHRDGVLAVAYEGDTDAEWRITFAGEDGSVLANGKPWERL